MNVTENFFKRKVTIEEALDFDSMTLIEYLFELETAINITFDVTRIDIEDFRCVQKIVEYISKNFEVQEADCYD
jgi:acyl carrier protein